MSNPELIVEKPQMLQRSELAPCPFCGKQPYWGMGKLGHCQLHGEPMQSIIIYCKNPDCFVKPSMSYGDIHCGGEARVRIEAARKWGYRA